MRRAATIALVLAAFATAVPAGASQLTDSPYGREDNAIGTLRWLPKNANESVPGGQFRLVVVYDRSINDAGAPVTLKVKGAFGVKIFTTSQTDLTMKSHSAKVGDLNTLTGQTLPAQANETVAGVYGDVRDGACNKLATAGAFSEAYSTTRQFFHAGQTAYAPVSAPGTCEVVDLSTEIRNGAGDLLGFDTRVTNHVPGFWINVSWPVRSVPLFTDTGRALAEVWYGAAYDSAGDPGPFPNGADASSSSKSVYSPGDYDAIYSFTANPGAIGAECVDSTGTGVGAPGSWSDIKVQVPATAKKVTFMLFPKGDWDLIVIDPEGNRGLAGAAGGLSETEVVPTAGTNNLATLIPGEYTMRGCNFTGEQTVAGSVQIDF